MVFKRNIDKKKRLCVFHLSILFLFTNSPWITSSIRFDFVMFIFCYLYFAWLIFKYGRIHKIMLILLLMFLSGTFFGLINQNTGINYYFSAYDSYGRIFVGYMLASQLARYYSFEEILKFIVYWVAFPTYLFTVLWMVDPELTKDIISTVFSLKRNDWHRFSGIFGMPYLLSNFIVPILLSLFYLLMNENKKILSYFCILILFMAGTLALSKAFIVGCILCICLVLTTTILGKGNKKIFCVIIGITIFIIFKISPDYLLTQALTIDGIIETIEIRYFGNEHYQQTAGGNFDNWHWFYGIGLGKVFAATDSFYVELFSYFGVPGVVAFSLIVISLFYKIFNTRYLNYKIKIYYFYLLLFLMIAGIGSTSFVSDRTEVLIWFIISFGIFSPLYRRFNLTKHNPKLKQLQ